MALTNVHHAKRNLSSLIARAERGKAIVIACGKHPVVRPVPVKKIAKQRIPGMFKGEFELGSAFFEPLPEELSAWE